MNVYKTQLENGLLQLHLSLSETQQIKLLDYLTLLQKWNRAYNLTAITALDKMISYHLLDSLSIAPYLTGDYLVDVGSGAGLPGIPLAVFYPEKSFTLIDSVGKKTRFMQHAVRALDLANVTVVQSRAESYQPEKPFDTMVRGGVGPVALLVDIATHLLHANGKLLLMRADASEESLAASHEVFTLSVPGIEGKRSLMVVSVIGNR